MGQALRNKFNGNSTEVSDYAYTYGIFQAMREYDVSDYLAMCKFLVGASGDPNFVNKCIANSAAGKGVYSRIVDELIHRCVNAQARNEEMAQRVKILEKKMEFADQDNRQKALALLGLMQSTEKCELAEV